MYSWTGASWRERKCPNFETVAKGIQTRALTIVSLVFYRWGNGFHILWSAHPLWNMPQSVCINKANTWAGCKQGNHEWIRWTIGTQFANMRPACMIALWLLYGSNAHGMQMQYSDQLWDTSGQFRLVNSIPFPAKAKFSNLISTLPFKQCNFNPFQFRINGRQF